MKRTAPAIGLLVLAVFWLGVSVTAQEWSSRNLTGRDIPTYVSPNPAALSHGDGDEADTLAQCHVHPEAPDEKIRPLGERARPHSLYDVVGFFRNAETAAARAKQLASAHFKRQSSPNAPTYVFRCPVCRKTFRRATMDPLLNPHKGKGDWQCPGTYGVYVGTTF